MSGGLDNNKSAWFSNPDLADVFKGCEAIAIDGNYAVQNTSVAKTRLVMTFRKKWFQTLHLRIGSQKNYF